MVIFGFKSFRSLALVQWNAYIDLRLPILHKCVSLDAKAVRKVHPDRRTLLLEQSHNWRERWGGTYKKDPMKWH